MVNDNKTTQTIPRRRRRRPRSTKESPTNEANENLVPAEEEAAAPPEASGTDTTPRRRRRRTRNAKETTPESPAPEAATSALNLEAAQPDTTALEALIAKQNALLSSHLSRQGAVLREIRDRLGGLVREGQTGEGGEAAAAQMGLRRPRVGIFVDVPNIQYAAERLGLQLDYGRLLAMLCKGRELVRASAYAPVAEDTRDPSRLVTQRFVQPFVGKGYKIVTKPLKRFGDGSVKANFDVELAIDILTMSERLDLVCLVSGDGDFSRLVELVQSRGVRVEVVAFAGSTSNELRALADDYIELDARLEELRAKD